MPLRLDYPEKEVQKVVHFLRNIFKQNSKKSGVIAVSGGIDSALSVTLLTKALEAKNVYPLLLPFDKQDTSDSEAVLKWNKIPEKNWQIINIKPFIAAAQKVLPDLEKDSYRLGNLMARSRMLVVYDQAKKLDALVCGTENKSEEYLGYFTRFGDEASDIEPIQAYYKTQVRQLVEFLKLPAVFLEKAPSAGLWQNQTDENELGFSYAQADLVLEELIEKKNGRLYLLLIEGKRTDQVIKEITTALPDLDEKKIEAVIDRVASQQFKHEVPYVV